MLVTTIATAAASAEPHDVGELAGRRDRSVPCPASVVRRWARRPARRRPPRRAARVTPSPSRSSGEIATPRRIVSIAPMSSPVSIRVPRRRVRSPSWSASHPSGSSWRGLLVGGDQARVGPAAVEQLGVGAAVDDGAVVEVDAPRRRGRSWPCGRRPRPACVGRPARRLGQDAGLDLRVDGRRGVVEDQQSRPAYQRTGQRDALPLPTGQRRAALPQLGVEAVAERGHEAVGLRSRAAPPTRPRRGCRRRA